MNYNIRILILSLSLCLTFGSSAAWPGGNIFSGLFGKAAKSNSKCEMTEDLPDPKSKCCGVDSSLTPFIVGGNKTALRQYPWLVLIEYETNWRAIVTQCGGSLINGRYVITAAHCVVGSILDMSVPVSVRLGEYDTTTDPDTDEGGNHNNPKISIGIHNIIFHESYTRNLSNDIALIRLKTLATYTDYIRPICMPMSDVTKNPPKNLRFYVAGWGVMMQNRLQNGSFRNTCSPVKRHVDLPYMELSQCSQIYSNISTQDKTRICAGGEKGKGTCSGDSGGPLMDRKDGKYNLVGVLSGGKNEPCGKEGWPSIFTKVYGCKKWVDGSIKMLKNEAQKANNVEFNKKIQEQEEKLIKEIDSLQTRERKLYSYLYQKPETYPSNKEFINFKNQVDELFKSLYLIRASRLYIWQKPELINPQYQTQKIYWDTNMLNLRPEQTNY